MPEPGPLPIVDGHLDLAESVTLFGRDLTQPLPELRGTTHWATVSLPELRRGGIAVAIATVTAGFRVEDVGASFEPRSALYETPEQAEANALAQIELYRRWERAGHVRLLGSRADLEHHLELWRDDGAPGLVLLMEGADPIVRVGDLAAWWQRGLRIIGVTFGDTRYGSGVTGGGVQRTPGGLTSDGVALLSSMAELGFAWDVSHLSDEGVRQGLDLGMRSVCASHANSRALIPTARHLTDDVMRAIAERGGVVGVVLYNGFLEPAWPGDRSVRVSVDVHVRRHLTYMAGVAGWDHVGIGSDLDGGFGRDGAPAEIDSIADLPTIGSAVPETARPLVLGENWLRFLRRALPA